MTDHQTNELISSLAHEDADDDDDDDHDGDSDDDDHTAASSLVLLRMS